MARKTKNEKIREYGLSFSLTVKQIKDYIRSATEAVNRTIRKKGSGVHQLDVMLEHIREKAVAARQLKKYGTKIQGIGYGFKGKRKAELLEQAQSLQSYLKQYSSLKTKGDFVSEQEKRAYENAVKTLGEMSLQEYRWVRDLLSDIKKDFGKKYESKDVYEDIKNYYDDLGHTKFLDIIRDVYTSTQGNGLTKSQFRNVVRERLEIELEVQYKLKKGLLDMKPSDYVKQNLAKRVKEKININLSME